MAKKVNFAAKKPKGKKKKGSAGDFNFGANTGKKRRSGRGGGS